ncbi:hypothetical protein [Sulfitobacter mediterraneus]|uniref:hypothetical protein n=1 Tax=Sulfitobacter mediterraneus TaxID=83219 RepID=UPI0012DDACD0|nr:hypothetical protein [Sulfitobacter mediterraneus]
MTLRTRSIFSLKYGLMVGDPGIERGQCVSAREPQVAPATKKRAGLIRGINRGVLGVGFERGCAVTLRRKMTLRTRSIFSLKNCTVVVVTVCIEPVSANISLLSGNLTGKSATIASNWSADISQVYDT